MLSFLFLKQTERICLVIESVNFKLLGLQHIIDIVNLDNYFLLDT